jgi:hypothetical protein
MPDVEDRPSTSQAAASTSAEDEKDGLSTVKMALRTAASSLDADQYQSFMSIVEPAVHAVSKMFRRTSILLHLALLRLASDVDTPLPNLYEATTTFWKHLLSQTDKNTEAGARAILSCVQDVLPMVEKVDVVAMLPDNEIREQLVTYAATTFQTAVMNNAWVPLIPRLKRLVSLMIKLNGRHGITTWELLSKIRLPDTHENIINCNLPTWATKFRERVRKMLRVPSDAYIHDEYAKKKKSTGVSFDVIYRFNLWMHEEFKRHNHRGIKLSPIFRVRRACVRLDKCILAKIAFKILGREDASSTTPWTTLKKDSGLIKRLINRLVGGSAAIRGVRRFDYSMSTDGVVANLSCATRKPNTIKAEEKKNERKSKRQSGQTETYDKHLSTMLSTKEQKHLILGLDPGRINIATVAYYVSDSEQRSWTLKRGQYYSESGIVRMEKRRRERFKALEPFWSDLGGFQSIESADDVGMSSALKTSDPAIVVSYIEKYNCRMDEWWELALKRRESRDEFQRYIGKRKVMDKFFSSISKEVGRTFPDVKVSVAYGQALMSMKSSGRGELAVPTTGAYRACSRIFEGRVTLVDECMTSQMHWETATRFDKVYMRRDKNDLFHLPYAQSSRVSQDSPDQEPVRKLTAALFRERCRRRGRQRCSEVDDQADLSSDGIRYPEVRGLRFVPETRKYLDRDVAAAMSIARLQVLHLSGVARPVAFRIQRTSAS